jgi:murein DD-endopeptidase MepM/ murein hydrolase activator NlpD
MYGNTMKEETKSKILEIKIKKGKFPITRLKVNPDKVTPTEEEKKRIEEEKKELEALYAHLESGPLWKSPFQLPVKTGVTSRYGGQRVFNGQLKSVHFGVDLKAAKGDPVYSMNDGKVILAKNFFYAGNLVVIDHGQGLVSSYAHLNEIKVGAGSVVKKGELLGKAGATGRVTGPHLHWAMRVNAVSVDPLQATKMVNSFAVLKGEP